MQTGGAEVDLMTTAAKVPARPACSRGFHPIRAVIIGDVTWEFYDRFSDPVRKGENCRVAFDGKDVEIMGIGPLHDWILSLLTVFVEIVSEDLKIECIPMGSTTWKREQIKRGIESDQCYYFDLAKMEVAGRPAANLSDKVADYPNPDLAVEFGISPSKIDRPGIYAGPEGARVSARPRRQGIDRKAHTERHLYADRIVQIPARAVRRRRQVDP